MCKRRVRTGPKRPPMTASQAVRDYADRLMAVELPKVADPLAKHALKRARKYLSDFSADMRTNFK